MSRTSSGGKTELEVPQIVLSDKKGEHRGVQGSYCWDGIAVDYQAPSTRTDLHKKLPVEKEARFTFRMVGYAKPEKFHVALFSKDKLMLSRSVKREMKLEVPKGTYVLGVQASWAGKGDLSNLFLVEVL